MLKYRILDASYIVNCFDPQNENYRIEDFLKDVLKEESFFYIPQFCIIEVLNTFTKWFYRKSNGKSKITLEQAKELTEIFVEMIKDKKYLYTYELNQNHVINSSKIFPVEHTTPKGNKSYLSTFDIAIISMGAELQFIHGKENFSIISSDKRLVDVSNAAGINAILY